MFSIPHLIIVFVVALVVFGPEKLPELARNMGKLMGEFRKATGDLRSTFEGHLRDLEREADLRRTGNSLPSNTIAAPAPALPAPYSPYTASPEAAEAEVSTALGAAGTVPTTPPHLNIGTPVNVDTPVPESPLPPPVTPVETSAVEIPAPATAEPVQEPPELQPEHHPESLTDAGIRPA
ncbi:MAG TPA: twin-arginine translocase TatA/TatE family subunit [Candidatus Acidoferrales bacterium]|jgi:TatA/E family protein of Tat protein translocase|nr:twin-arginine translocase TatA/TatE family subunit [Candidatus Acidoferrales bacterium]